MFCTIKFVYYKSFCVRDDIGSYIRTVYHMVSHTPKRQATGSNPAGGARSKAESPCFQGLSAFLIFCWVWLLAHCKSQALHFEVKTDHFLNNSTIVILRIRTPPRKRRKPLSLTPVYQKQNKVKKYRKPQDSRHFSPVYLFLRAWPFVVRRVFRPCISRILNLFFPDLHRFPLYGIDES